MVVTDFPATSEMGRMQVRTALPSRCTVQAPHWAIPHPNLVPVIPSTSRNTQSKGISSGTSTVFRTPFSVKVVDMGLPSLTRRRAGARTAAGEPTPGRDPFARSPDGGGEPPRLHISGGAPPGLWSAAPDGNHGRAAGAALRPAV